VGYTSTHKRTQTQKYDERLGRKSATSIHSTTATATATVIGALTSNVFGVRCTKCSCRRRHPAAAVAVADYNSTV